MKLNTVLNSVLNQLGGQSWQQVKMQSELLKANKAAGKTTARTTTNGTANPFLTALNQLAPAQLPTPPTDATNPDQLALYNQQLLNYVTRLHTQQALTSQRMQTQINQLAQALQQSRSTTASSAGNNSQYPSGSLLNGLSGVVNTQSDSLLLDSPSPN